MPHTPLSRSIVFGAINSVATIPTLIAFAAIVFKEPVYAPYVDQLCKFFFLSSAIHQAVFCLLSSLPYAIGQVRLEAMELAQCRCKLPESSSAFLLGPVGLQAWLLAGHGDVNI